MYPSLRIERLLAEGRDGVRSRHAPARPGGPAMPLAIGAATGALFGCVDDWIAANAPAIPRYGSQVHVIERARIHSSAGIVILPSGEVIADTLDHTAPERDAYHVLPGGGIAIEGVAGRLRGRFLSLLLGAYDNHFHLLLMNIARLAILDDADLRGLDGILVPADLGAIGREALALAGVERHARLRPVARGETLVADTLVLPWNVASSFGVNPDAARFLHDLGAKIAPVRAGRRLYVDRRGATRRALANEADIAEALGRLDVEPIRFETMPLAAQIAAMRSAELVIGPHGAGLANIVFAGHQARIVELRPPAGINWCYRYLAASCGQDYDCVWGRQVPEGGDGWRVSPAHAASAVSRA